MNEYQPYIMIAIGLVSSGILAWGWRTSKKAMQLLQNLHELLTPNGGSSVADKVNGLVETQENILRGQIENKAWQQTTDVRLKTLEIAIIEMRKSDERVRINLQERENAGGQE